MNFLNRQIILYLVISVFMLLFSNSSVTKFIKGSAYKFISPFTKKVYQLNSQGSNINTTLSQIKSLAKDNAELKKENETLKARVAGLEEISYRVEVLEKELNFQKSYSENSFIASAVIGRSPSSFRSVISIDKGSQDSIKVNQPVISNGFLIGKIVDVYTNSSQVELISSHRFITPVILQDTRQQGLLRGGLKGITIEQLPIGADIKGKEEVLTSGIAGELPSGIPVGFIGKIISKPSDIFQTVSLENPVEFNKVELVLVIKNTNE